MNGVRGTSCTREVFVPLMVGGRPLRGGGGWTGRRSGQGRDGVLAPDAGEGAARGSLGTRGTGGLQQIDLRALPCSYLHVSLA